MEATKARAAQADVFDDVDELRARDYPQLHDQVYLDYTGASLAAASQLRAHHQLLAHQVYGNPHSASPASKASTQLADSTRYAVLRFFNADPDEYVVIWTPNATGACRLVGEAYPWQPGSALLLTLDNHNSVLGLREYAKTKGARVSYVPLTSQLRTVKEQLVEQLEAVPILCSYPDAPRLFAYPAQSNFSGVQHPLWWIERAHECGWDVLLDAAAFAPTNRLDLSKHHPDFVAISFYKMFGYPTGVGALIARRQTLIKLRRPWFSGGTVLAASAQGGWHSHAQVPDAFEDGTLNYLSLPAVAIGLRHLDHVGLEAIGERTQELTQQLLALRGLVHRDGTSAVHLYGPCTTVSRGATVAFNFIDRSGRVVDERVIEREAASRKISLRTGCFCNPGAGEAAFGLDPGRLERLGSADRSGGMALDDYLRLLGLPSGGAVRVSLGIASNLADVTRFLGFAETFVDRQHDLTGLPPRSHC